MSANLEDLSDGANLPVDYSVIVVTFQDLDHGEELVPLSPPLHIVNNVCHWKTAT